MPARPFCQEDILQLFPSVYVDLDDTIAESARSFVEVLENRFHRSALFEDICSFDLGKSFHLSEPELSEFMRAIHEDTVLSNIVPIAGAKEELAYWKQIGVVIVIVTGRPTYTYSSTRNWLLANHIPYNSLQFVNKYSQEPRERSAYPKCQSLHSLKRSHFTVVVDDSPKMISFVARHLQTPVAVLNRPWNKVIPRMTNENQHLVRRCSNWREITRVLLDIMLDAPRC